MPTYAQIAATDTQTPQIFTRGRALLLLSDGDHANIMGTAAATVLRIAYVPRISASKMNTEGLRWSSHSRTPRSANECND